MNAVWQKLSNRVDALSFRERVLVALAGVAACIFLAYAVLIAPAATREQALAAQIAAQRTQMATIAADIVQKQSEAAADPDAATRKRLLAVKADNLALRAALRNARQGLVQPGMMSALLQGMVQQNGKVKLLSLKTQAPLGTTDGTFKASEASVQPAVAGSLPPMPGQAVPQAAAAATGPARREPLLYRHGVELVLQGSYTDLLAYMTALERMPAQLFWGRAVLDATEHDKTTLSLTLYTLSLDEKWIAL